MLKAYMIKCPSLDKMVRITKENADITIAQKEGHQGRWCAVTAQVICPCGERHEIEIFSSEGD